MFSLSNMSSTASVLASYTSFVASAMLVRTVINEVQTLSNQLVPQKLQEKILSSLGDLFGRSPTQLTLIIKEYNGFSQNEIYQASEVYLSTRITPSVGQLMVSKSPSEKGLSVTVDKGQKIVDTYEGIQLVWEFVTTETQKLMLDSEFGSQTEKTEHRSFLLSFHKQHKDKVLNAYLPYVVERSKAIKDQNKVVKLHSLGGPWVSVNLDHPSNFDTLAMDPVVKKELLDDLDRFVRRRDFYRRVGKPWKRGYLLYGPPGTGKSSLIAAMANYLKFDIYDMELTSLRGNADLRGLLTATTNRSILVIEDIDCSIDLENRQHGGHSYGDNQLTLSGLLNFIDGLWSSCGDERIIVFTTNYKERLDPALIRPGRMDKHINMSYCTPSGFRILASNYLEITDHHLFAEIEQMMTQVEATPAEVAEELMKSEQVDGALQGLIGFLQKKRETKRKAEGQEVEEVHDELDESKKESQEMEVKCQAKKKAKRNRRKTARK